MMTGLHKKALRDLRRRMPQVAAIAATVTLGVLLFVASYDSFRNVQASYDRTYARTHFADLTVTVGDADTIAAAVRDAPGVEHVVTRTQADRPMSIGATKLVGRVVGMPPASGHAINEIDLVAGRLPDPARSDEVVVERHTADTFGLAAGERVRVFDDTAWRDVTVAGVAQSPEYLWPARNRQDLLGDPHAFAVIFAPESPARALSARTAPNQVLIEMTGSAAQSDRDRVTRLLRPAKREVLCAVYALARRIDDIGDGDLPAEQKIADLEQARQSVLSLDSQDGADPVLAALADTKRNFPLVPVEAFGEIIDGCVADVRGTHYETFEDLHGAVMVGDSELPIID